MIEQRDLNIIFNNPIDWEYFRNKTILVTGATGRLGMYLVEAFCEADLRWNLNMRVVALARSKDKLNRVFGTTLDLPNVRVLVQDIMDEIDCAEHVDIIFHTAGMASPSEFTATPVETLWGHVQGTRNVLELAKKHKSQQVFYVSTVEIYGEWKKDALICEDDMGPMECNRARSCYPEAKRLCETMLASYMQQYNVGYRGVRCCHTFGPGISLHDGRAFAEFLRSVLEKRDIVLQSDGSAMRTYTYVADAIGAMLLIASKGKDGEFYNVANIDNLVSIRDLAKMIAGLHPEYKVDVIFDDEKKTALQYLPFKLAIMNVDKIKALGWNPCVGLEEAFSYTLDSFLQRS